MSDTRHDIAIARELGCINARLNGQDEAMAAQSAMLAAMNAQLAEMNKFMNQHKGGVRMAVMLGSAAAAVGAAVPFLYTFLRGHNG